MTTERGLALVMLVVSGLLFSSLAGPAWRIWRIYAGTRSRRQHDAAGSAPLPTPEVAARIGSLVALGFTRAGETFVDLPDTGRRFVWQLVHDDRDTYAAIVPNTAVGALVGIYSAWPDGTWLTTMHPVGETIDRAGLVVQVARERLADAFEAHRLRAAALRASHGPPRRVQSLADILVLDADYRSRYGGRTLVRRTTRLVLPAVLGGILLVLALVLLAVTAR